MVKRQNIGRDFFAEAEPLRAALDGRFKDPAWQPHRHESNAKLCRIQRRDFASLSGPVDRA